MRIERFEIISYRLPLRTPWVSASGRMSARRGFIVRLYAEGLCGMGDAAPLEQVGTESLSECLTWLRQQRPEGISVHDALAALPFPAECPPAARCGLETALLDLASQAAGLSLARYLNPKAARDVSVNANAGALRDGLSTTIARLSREGYSIVKLKVGLDAPETELAHLRALCSDLPEGVRLRLDANRAWTLPQAEIMLEGLADLPIESVEEPLSSSVPVSELARLQAESPFPLALDESLGRTVNMGTVSANRLVLKPVRMGGLLPALELAGQAQARAIEAVITTTVDSAIGGWAAAHLAAAVDQGLAHGLDTGRWLAADLAAAPTPQDGYISLPEVTGLGVDCRQILLARAASK